MFLNPSEILSKNSSNDTTLRGIYNSMININVKNPPIHKLNIASQSLKASIIFAPSNIPPVYTIANTQEAIRKTTGKIKTTEQLYSEIIGERTVAKEKVYVNAIIDTNYEEECREARDLLSQLTTESNLEDLKSDPIYINFTTAVNERFNVTYSFDENYREALCEYLDTNGAYMRASAFFIKGAKYSSSVGCAFIIDSKNEYNLADGEIAMSTTLYNSAIALSDEKVYSADLADKNKALAESPEEISAAVSDDSE